jgi:hypothetical protein
LVLRSDSNFGREEVWLQFRLTYEGELLPSFNNTKRGGHKHFVRRKFHPQLRRLWEITPSLSEMQFPLDENILTVRAPLAPRMAEHLASTRLLGGYRFVPLVTEELALWCGLDILFLRPGRAGRILSAGDIDNRIKTIVDALKRPTNLEEIGNSSPGYAEDPFYCLLDDDSHVAQLAVETDELLEPVGGGIPSARDARIVITVTLRPAVVSMRNLAFA